MPGRPALRGISFLLLLAVFASVGPSPARSVTKSQVQEACRDSAAQYEQYEAAQRAYEEAWLTYEATQNEIAALEYKRERITGIVERREEEIADTTERIEALAVELYMQGGGSSSLVLFASSVDEVLTGSEFLSAATEDDLGSLDDMLALRADLERFQEELAVLDAELRDTEAENLLALEAAQQAAADQQAAWEALSSTCRSCGPGTSASSPSSGPGSWPGAAAPPGGWERSAASAVRSPDRRSSTRGVRRGPEAAPTRAPT